MKSAAYVLLLALAIALSGCGSTNNSTQGSNPNAISGLKNRAFVANAIQTSIGVGGGIQILDAQHDQFTTFTIQGITAIAPQSITLLPGALCRTSVNTNPSNNVCGLGATFSNSNNTIYIFDPTNESNLGNVTLPGDIGNFVISPDARFVYAASPQLGEVFTIDIVGFTLFPTVNLLGAHHVALSPDGTTLMIVSDNSNVVTVMNTATRATYSVADSGNVIDHPVAAFFLDNSDAVVLSCGAECGGTQASVASISLTQQQVVNHTNVDGATAGLLTNGTLFVAGNCVTLPCANSSNLLLGELSILNVTSTGSTLSAVMGINGGYHQSITKVQNSELFVGSIGEPGPGQCANPTPTTPPPGFTNPGGCLSIVNPVSHQVTTDTPHGDVTGAAPITGRSVVYVTEGGQLLIYDTTTMLPFKTTPNIAIAGFLTDVKAAN